MWNVPARLSDFSIFDEAQKIFVTVTYACTL